MREISEHDGSVKITNYFARAYILAEFSRTIDIRGFVIILTLKIYIEFILQGNTEVNKEKGNLIIFTLIKRR